MGFRALQVRGPAEAVAGEVDFSTGGNSTGLTIFGFSESEAWGTWSVGRTSGVVVWLDRHPTEDLILTLDADVFPGVGQELDVLVSTNLGHRTQIRIRHGRGSSWCELRRPEQPGRTPYFDHSIVQFDPQNCSATDRPPVVSIIILNFNRPELTILSAMSVLGAGIGVPYEVLVIDNGSEPNAVELLRQHSLPLRIECLSSNRFFGEGNNLGADRARGDYLLFLNNDAFVAKGCVDQLLDCFAREPACGAAAPVFYYPNGALQEAGALVSTDGMTVQRGKHSPFDVDSLLDINAVDYVSAACLMIPADTFTAIGGFNYRFDPAYYEDVDLCFRLRALGKTAVVAKHARCMHIENASSASAGDDFKLHEVSGHNRSVFVSLWDDYLSLRSPESLRSAAADPVPGHRARVPPENVTFFDGPVLPTADFRYATATALAMEGLGAAALVLPSPCSTYRLRNVLGDLGGRMGDLGAVEIASLADRVLGRSVDVGRGLYPQHSWPARRSCFVNLAPGLPVDATEFEVHAGLNRLAACQSVIVPSQFAKTTYEQALARYGYSANIQVVYSTANRPSASGLQQQKKPWVMSFDAFDGAADPGSHEALIEAFRITSAGFRRDWTLVLCGNAPNDGRSRAYLRRLQEMVSGEMNVKFVLSPSRARLDRLMAESAVFASALGVGASDPADTAGCDYVGSAMMEAMAQGCDLIAYEIGVGPELIARTGRGRLYGSVFELAHLLEVSAVDQPRGSSEIDFGFPVDHQGFRERFLGAMDAPQ